MEVGSGLGEPKPGGTVRRIEEELERDILCAFRQ